MTTGDSDNFILSPITRRSFLIGAAGAAFLKLPLPANAGIGLFDPFSFAAVSDVHLTVDRPDSFMLLRESQLFLQDVVRQLNDEKLDFIVFTGDQVEALGKNQANWQLFLDVAHGLSAPWTFVLGEHDITDELPVDKMRTYGPDWKGRGIETDHPYWSQSPLPGVHIVGLDTSRPNSPTGDMSQRQLDWLKKDLEANRRKFTIVFSHHPLLPPPPYDGGPPWDEYILPPGPAVREVLGSFPHVHLAISSHVYVSKVEREKDIWYVSCPALTVYPSTFRIFHVAPEVITMESRQVSFPALVKKGRKLLIASSLAFKYSKTNPESFVSVAEGERIDNDSLLPLEAGKEAQVLSKKKAKKAKKKKKKESPQGKAKGPSGSKTTPVKPEPGPTKANPAPESQEAPSTKPVPSEETRAPAGK